MPAVILVNFDISPIYVLILASMEINNLEIGK